MGALHKIPQQHTGQIDHVGLATLLRGVSASTKGVASRTALFLALKELGSQPAGVPPDGAFAQLLSQTVADLLLPGNEGKLDSILRYHAIASRVQARRTARVDLR